MQELCCETCANRVLVEKYSDVHTSVQWLADAESTCPEFGRRAALGEHSKWIPTCPQLRISIDRAAASGRLPINSERPDERKLLI